MTHPHIDHIGGIPFVELFYDPNADFTIGAAQRAGKPGGGARRAFAALARLRSHRLSRNEGDSRLSNRRAGNGISDRRNASLGLRLESSRRLRGLSVGSGRQAACVGDRSRTRRRADLALAEFARGADLLYADAQYLPEEYRGEAGIGGSPAIPHRGWGHSTIDDVIATAVEAGVKRLHLGHHEPRRGDLEFLHLEQRAEQLLAETLRAAGRSPDACQVQLACEDMTLEI